MDWFKPDSWQSLRQMLQSSSFSLACKLDLQDWFHHLSHPSESMRWTRCRISEVGSLQNGGVTIWAQHQPTLELETLAKPLTGIPQKPGNQLNVVRRQPASPGKDEASLIRDMTVVLKTLTAAGILINPRKSLIKPMISLEYLGQALDILQAMVSSIHSKTLALMDKSCQGEEGQVNCAPEGGKSGGDAFRTMQKATWDSSESDGV